MTFRVGIGFDLHRTGPGIPLMLGGVHVPHDLGLVGHSDGDVLCHAVTDALLGACAAGNIGELFPDTDERYRNAASTTFVEAAAAVVRSRGYEIANVDSNILAERPRLLPYFPKMRSELAHRLGVSEDQVHVKAKTMERVGPIGAGEAIAAEAVVLLKRP